MNYIEQYKEINTLLDKIRTKAKNFSEREQNPYFDDLSYILAELKDIEGFLSDKYLKCN